MSAFTHALIDDLCLQLDMRSIADLRRVLAATSRMGELVDTLLELSHAGRDPIGRHLVNLSSLATASLEELARRHPERSLQAVVERISWSRPTGAYFASHWKSCSPMHGNLRLTGMRRGSSWAWTGRAPNRSTSSATTVRTSIRRMWVPRFAARVSGLRQCDELSRGTVGGCGRSVGRAKVGRSCSRFPRVNLGSRDVWL